MRRSWAVALLVTLAFPWTAEAQADPATGQAAEPWVVEDPTGDTTGPIPAQALGFVDIVRGEAVVGESDLDVRIAVADLQLDGAGSVGWEMWLSFEYRDAAFDLVLFPISTTSPATPDLERILYGPVEARLYRMGESPQVVATFPFGVDPTSRTFNATLPWSLVDSGGFAPRPGEPVRLVGFGSEWSGTGLGTAHNPDPLELPRPKGGDAAPFPDGTVATLPGAVGDLSLGTPQAVRYSNGEATTLHWPVEVTNHGSRDLDIRLEVTGRDGEARAPPGLRLEAGENRTVNVFATVPFSHQHGASRRFLLTADSSQGDRATLTLAVEYPAIAQPAGHHDTVWLHGAEEPFAGPLALPLDFWMNAAEEDSRGSAARLAGIDFWECPDAGELGPDYLSMGPEWIFRLDPALRIGLDARMGEVSRLDVTLAGEAALPPGTVYARALLVGPSAPGEEPGFGNFTDPDVAVVPVAASTSPVGVHLEFPLPASLDLVAPSTTENLGLLVLFCPDLPGPAAFGLTTAAAFGSFFRSPLFLLAGGRWTLPLDEYHDAIPVTPNAEGLALSVGDPVRRAAPGATVLWRPTLSFPEGDTARYAVRLFGSGAASARLLGGDEVTAGKDPVEVPVAFTVPDEAPGTVLDLLLEVTDVKDPLHTVALRLQAIVDPTAAADDAAAASALEASEEKESPALPMGLALAALALVAARRRQ